MARLYVARDRRRPERHDLGSLLCVHALRLLPPDTVQVTEVTSLSQAHHPAWLTGTPTLVVDEQQQVLRGHQALQYLQDLAVSLPKSSAPPSRAPPSRAPPPTPAPPPRPAPPTEEDDPWSVAPVEAQDEDADRKVTSDDLMRVMREREQQQGPPPMV